MESRKGVRNTPAASQPPQRSSLNMMQPHAMKIHGNWPETKTTFRISSTTNGIVAVHGSWPLTSLLLTGKRFYEETYDACWSTTAFEVQPLTPNDACWRLDQSLEPTCEALVLSNHLEHVRKLRVRVVVARFSMVRQSMRSRRANTQVCTISEIGLEVCVQRLVALAERLDEVFKGNARSLKVVEIEWLDDSPGDVNKTDLRVRRNSLKPFTSLGVQVQIKKLVLAEKGRQRVMGILRQVFGTANGNA